MSKLTPEERFFLDSLHDLEERIKYNTSYLLIKASGLLRQLLLDGDNSTALPLAKKYGIKLEFVGGDGLSKAYDFFRKYSSENEDALYPVFALELAIPETLKSGQGKTYNLDQFLKYVVIGSGATAFTVRDIILTLANVKGGVHSGKPKPKNPEQKELLTFDLMLLQGLPVSSHYLSQIALIVIKALAPVVDAILK